jgi:hypothetical protein
MKEHGGLDGKAPRTLDLVITWVTGQSHALATLPQRKSLWSWFSYNFDLPSLSPVRMKPWGCIHNSMTSRASPVAGNNEGWYIQTLTVALRLGTLWAAGPVVSGGRAMASSDVAWGTGLDSSSSHRFVLRCDNCNNQHCASPEQSGEQDEMRKLHNREISSLHDDIDQGGGDEWDM